jgi:hypothetical protein
MDATRSFMNALEADPGFDTAGVLTVEWSLPPERYDSVAVFHEFQLPLLDRLRMFRASWPPASYPTCP